MCFLVPTSLVRKPPRGIQRWFLRAPIFLYRIGLGGLLGNRFMLINHVGRKSGKVHQTVIEVVDYDSSSDTYYVVSGWGYKAQWVRNLCATPAIEIQVERRKLSVRAETLASANVVKVLLAYRSKHPIAARELSRVMGIDTSTSTPEQLQSTISARMPVIRLAKVIADAKAKNETYHSNT